MLVKVWMVEPENQYWAMHDGVTKLRWHQPEEPLNLQTDAAIDDAIWDWCEQAADHTLVYLTGGRHLKAATWFWWVDRESGESYLMVTDAGPKFILSDNGDTIERVR